MNCAATAVAIASPSRSTVIAMEAYSLDGVRRLEDKGVTDVIVGFRNAYEKDSMPLQQKVDALRGYADRIIAKLLRRCFPSSGTAPALYGPGRAAGPGTRPASA